MIKKLSKEVWSKIQAGEVVESYASVLRELIDNSVDANSKTIRVSIENDDLYKIIVEDDGNGITYEDSFLLFINHATSKIDKFEDLNNLLTMGFRGEALYSIGNVSYVNLKSRNVNEESGFEIAVNGGKKIIHQKIAFSKGTKITVQNLFFNVPARQKFIEDKSKQLTDIKQIFFDKAFSSYNVSFELQTGKKTLYSFPSSERIEDRISMLYPNLTIDNLSYVDLEDVKRHNPSFLEKYGITNIKLLFSNRYSYSKNRSIFHFSFNRRSAINENLLKRLKGFYSNYLPKGFYPYFFMQLNINPSYIDCNVHPTKKNVKIYDESNFILTLIDIINKKLEENQKSFFIQEDENFISQKNFGNEILNNDARSFISAIGDNPIKLDIIVNNDLKEGNLFFENDEEIYQKVELDPSDFYKKGKFLGQIFYTYILYEYDDILMVVDQHAADERITYNTILKNINKKKRILLFSKVIYIKDIVNIEKLIELFENAGIEISVLGKNQIQVTAIPDIVPVEDEENFVNEIGNFIELNSIEELTKKEVTEFISLFYKSIIEKSACHLAIRQSDKLIEEDARRLLRKLFNQENFENCPHGRPTFFLLNKKDFEKVFLRKK